MMPEATIDPPAFAHESEQLLAAVFESYGVRWLYEPTTFVLAEGTDGKPLWGFTPDFFLPDYGTYIELTTMRQSLVTKKNRKIRTFRERYPDLPLTVLYTRDVARLHHKYGHLVNATPVLATTPVVVPGAAA